MRKYTWNTTHKNPLPRGGEKPAGFFVHERCCFAQCWLTLLLFFSLLFFSSFRNHDFHSSLAEIHYNSASKSLEISLRVFSDDLESALTKANNRTIRIDESTAAEPLIAQYLNKHFSLLDARSARKPIIWVGKELTVDVTWLYFEIPLTENLNGLKLHNSVLFELFSDQVNIVNISYQGQKRTYLFKPDQATQTVQW